MKKHKKKQNHRDFTFKEQIKFQHLFYGNSKPDNVLCILFVTGHKSTIVIIAEILLKVVLKHQKSKSIGKKM
jgi:hypothetical protein